MAEASEQERNKAVYRYLLKKFGEPTPHGTAEPMSFVEKSGRVRDVLLSRKLVNIEDPSTLRLRTRLYLPYDYGHLGVRVVAKRIIPKDFDPDNSCDPESWSKNPVFIVVDGEEYDAEHNFSSPWGTYAVPTIAHSFALDSEGLTKVTEFYTSRAPSQTFPTWHHDQAIVSHKLKEGFWEEVQRLVDTEILINTPRFHHWPARRPWPVVRLLHRLAERFSAQD